MLTPVQRCRYRWIHLRAFCTASNDKKWPMKMKLNGFSEGTGSVRRQSDLFGMLMGQVSALRGTHLSSFGAVISPDAGNDRCATDRRNTLAMSADHQRPFSVANYTVNWMHPHRNRRAEMGQQENENSLSVFKCLFPFSNFPNRWKVLKLLAARLRLWINWTLRTLTIFAEWHVHVVGWEEREREGKKGGTKDEDALYR